MYVLQSSVEAFLISLITGGIVAYPVWKLLIRLKSRQTIYHLAPETHQVKQGTPTMGGIIILIGLLTTLVIKGFEARRTVEMPDGGALQLRPLNYWLWLWIIGFALIGFADDYLVPKLVKGKRGLGWKQKIVAQVLLAVAATPVFHLPWEPATVIVTAFLVLFFCNAYNFADGLDALAASLGLLLCIGFSLIGLSIDGRPDLLMFALAGAYIPFLFLNAPPAKVFMGDVGSLPIGAIFGATFAQFLFGGWQFQTMGRGPISVENWHPGVVLPLVILSFIMIAELVPVPMQVAYYKLTKKRLFPMTPIHHAFEKKGWPESRVVWSFVLTQFALCVLAFGITLIGRPALELGPSRDMDLHIVGMARP